MYTEHGLGLLSQHLQGGQKSPELWVYSILLVTRPLVSSVLRFKGQLCHVILLLRLERDDEAREVLQQVREVTTECVCVCVCVCVCGL